jgi:hypothetical protein
VFLSRGGSALATAAAAACLLVAAPAASADTATCSLSGVAGNLAPNIWPMPTTGGAGVYSFSGRADCQYVDDVLGPLGAVAATIASSGEFKNDTCSFGWAFSDWGMGPIDDPDRTGATTMNFAHSRATDITAMRYMIRFDAGVGQLVIQDVNGNPSARGAGEVQIITSPGSSCLPGSSGVSSFDVLGAFTTTIP